MPKFIYTILFIVFGLWYWVFSYVSSESPDTYTRILMFLVLVFVALALTLSIPLYYYLHKKASTFSNLRFLFRKAVKWGFYFSFGIVFFLGLRAFYLDTFINVVLFLIMYVLVLLQLTSKR